MTTKADDGQPPLPGLEDPEPSGPPPDALESAVRRTIAALHAKQLLHEHHAATCQLALDLAASVSAGRRSRRASAVAMAARELREVLASLPAIDQGDDEQDPWDALAREFAAADGKGASG